MKNDTPFLTKNETEELIKLTKELIRIPSTVKDGPDIYEYVEKYLKNKGLPVKKQSVKNLYDTYHGFSNLYVKQGNGKGPKIMLNGHLDTVGVERPWRWKHPPFDAIEENNRIYGRGAADVKGGMASVIIAYLAFLKRFPNIDGELFLSCVYGEESPFSLGADTLLREHQLDDYDLIIVTEPAPLLTVNDFCYTHDKIHKTKFPVTIVGAEGRIILVVEILGMAAHASHPSQGINALHDASTLISELARFDIFTNIKRGRGHYVVLNIEGGDPTFTVPEYCRILINRQIMLGESPKTVIREIKKIIKSLRLRSKVNIYKQKIPDSSLEYKPYVNHEDEYVNKFLKSLEETGDLCKKQAGSKLSDCKLCKFVTRSVGDFNLFGTRTKAPTIVFGPGGGNIHAPNEYVNREEVIATANYLLEFFRKVYS